MWKHLDAPARKSHRSRLAAWDNAICCACSLRKSCALLPSCAGFRESTLSAPLPLLHLGGFHLFHLWRIRIYFALSIYERTALSRRKSDIAALRIDTRIVHLRTLAGRQVQMEAGS
jgi:hypothetical protein